MSNTKTVQIRFYNAQEVSTMLGVSKTTAHRIIKKLNDTLAADGYIIVPGKISKKYFESKVVM